MGRIEQKFSELAERNEKALITYISMGDPSLEQSEAVIHTIAKNGADIIEIGIPYSDPLADGPVIEAAGQRALDNGFRLQDAFACLKRVRLANRVPLVIMCYYNTVFGHGRDLFIKECVEAGIDGVIVPDLPMEEREELAPFLEAKNIDLIPLVALTSADRIPAITETARGFVYCVSSLGVTGVRKSFDVRVDQFLKDTKDVSPVPVCVGFGIGTKPDVERFRDLVDGVIVGSALVKKIYESECNLAEVGAFVKELKSGTKLTVKPE